MRDGGARSAGAFAWRQAAGKAVKATLNRVARALQPARPVGRRLLGESLLILGYHTVVREAMDPPDPCFTAAGQFRREMLQLRGLGYQFLPLVEAVDRLRDRALGRPTVCITFDDGLAGVFHAALPILRELRIPATVFLVTDLIDSAETLWYCRLLDAVSRTRSATLEWGGRAYDLSTRDARRLSSWRLQALLKGGDDQALARDLEEIRARLGQPADDPVPEASPFRLLGSGQIAEMSGSGLVGFGAHTARHTILTRTPRENARREIARSVAAVAALTGERCRTFSYPNGRPADFDPGIMEILRESGVDIAVTTCTGWNRPSTPRLVLRRVLAGEPSDERGYSWRTNPLRIFLMSRRGLSS